MIVGCFALVEPFASVQRQFQALHELGICYADLTDNHNGGMLGVEYGFSASISLDSHPAKIRHLAEEAGLTLTSFCAHANLLDPPSPDVYGTTEIIKAIRLARLLGIRHVITTEGDPKTAFGRNLSHAERIFAIRERLYAPLLWAEELGVELLLETHGVVTDTVSGMGELLDVLGHEKHLGICLDTGNSWLGGAEPLDYVHAFGPRIKHVHWKDMGSQWLDRRGTLFGCGMATIALGDGVINLRAIVQALKAVGFDGATTLEIAGLDNIRRSLERLQAWVQESP
jgi:inosose dehydratase